jgi:hypothetical protein
MLAAEDLYQLHPASTLKVLLNGLKLNIRDPYASTGHSFQATGKPAMVHMGMGDEYPINVFKGTSNPRQRCFQG